MEKILFNVPGHEKTLWMEAAKREQTTLSEWLRQAARDRLKTQTPVETRIESLIETIQARVNREH